MQKLKFILEEREAAFHRESSPEEVKKDADLAKEEAAKLENCDGVYLSVFYDEDVYIFWAFYRLETDEQLEERKARYEAQVLNAKVAQYNQLKKDLGL